MTPLVELDPRWCSTHRWRLGQGVNFNCPCLLCGRRITVWFANPIDGLEPVETANSGWLWWRDGISFEELSAYPAREPPDGAHWWGSIEKGQVN